MTAWPDLAVARHQLGVGQETDVNGVPLVTATGGYQRLRFQVIAWPDASTAMQNAVLAHEIPVSLLPPLPGSLESMWSAADHVVPFHSKALPAVSTAMQNAVPAHETRSISAVSMAAGRLHEAPFHIDTPPRAAMQKLALAQDTPLAPP